jgi:hypothetical protein
VHGIYISFGVKQGDFGLFLNKGPVITGKKRRTYYEQENVDFIHVNPD